MVEIEEQPGDPETVPPAEPRRPTPAQNVYNYLTERIRLDGYASHNAWARAHDITGSNMSFWGNGETVDISLKMARKLGIALGLTAVDILRIAGYDELETDTDMPLHPPTLVKIDDAIDRDPDPLLDGEAREVLRVLVGTLREQGRLKRGRRGSAKR